MATGPQKDFESCSVDGLYRLLNNMGLTVSGLGPTFGNSRGQARKYLKLALGLGLVVGDVNPRYSEYRRRRAGAWDRYYHTTRRGERVLDWLRRYAAGEKVHRYPDPPLLRGSTRRRPRFPDRR